MPTNTVLLVDDDVMTARALRRILTAHGFDVETAMDAESAIQRSRERSFDVIVSDISLPGLTGIDFLRSLREHDADVPVIMITAAPSIATAARSLEFGVMRYLSKPLDTRVLTTAVAEAAAQHLKIRQERETLAHVVAARIRRLGDRASLDGRFRSAVETLWIAAQPIVSLAERRVYGYECLLRSGSTDLATPVAIVEAAEQLGSLDTLGRTIRATIAHGAALAPPDALLFVNLHPLDLMDDDLGSPDAPLSQFASRIVLELTERHSIDSIAELDERVAGLRKLGFRLAIDDLGAGYAGLTSLTRLQPEIVKFDMTLVRGIDADPSRQRIVGAMKRLCDDLGIAVVVEGVETRGESEALRDLGCELLQGYYFARPGPGFPVPAWESR